MPNWDKIIVGDAFKLPSRAPRFYLDLMYKRRVDLLDHGHLGPEASYMPICDAWRSNRKTTKDQPVTR